MAKHTVKIQDPKGGDAAQRAMLLKVVIHQWKGRSHDKRISDEVAERYEADENMGTYLKQLVAKERLAMIGSLTSQIRQLWYERTLPWLDQGTRILPNALYFKTMEQMDALIHKREDAVLELANKWEEVVEEAKLRLNGLFNEDDYPSPTALRNAYRIQVIPMPFPKGADFRMGVLGPENEVQEAELRAEVDDAVKNAVADATRELWQRIHDVTSKMADRLPAYTVRQRGGKAIVNNPFRDTLVENIRDLVELLPALNVTDDPVLDGLTDKIRDQLCTHDAEALRNDPKLRRQTARAAEKILKEVSDFLG